MNVTSVTSGDDDFYTRQGPILTALLSILIFILSGLLEIGGCYLVWRGIKGTEKIDFRAMYIVLGCLSLAAYGFIPTLQPPQEGFGRIFAVYGGFFIVLSFAWAALFDGFVLDTGDYIGCFISLAGVLCVWFWPRKGA